MEQHARMLPPVARWTCRVWQLENDTATAIGTTGRWHVLCATSGNPSSLKKHLKTNHASSSSQICINKYDIICKHNLFISSPFIHAVIFTHSPRICHILPSFSAPQTHPQEWTPPYLLILQILPCVCLYVYHAWNEAYKKINNGLLEDRCFLLYLGNTPTWGMIRFVRHSRHLEVPYFS